MSHICLAQTESDKLVTIKFDNSTALEALQELNAIEYVRLSYNPEIVSSDIRIFKSYINEPIDKILKDILGSDFELKLRGSYVIIQKVNPNTTEKNKFKITGDIKDGKTGEILKDVTIYEINKLSSTLSDSRGNFELTVSAKTDYVTLGVSRQFYQDTIFQVKKQFINQEQLVLYPNEQKDGLQLDFLKDLETKIKSIDTRKLVQFFTTNKERKNAQNVDLIEKQNFQFSVIPNIGTNMNMSGSIKNRFSFNLLAGYSSGFNGIELGGFYNIDRKEIEGLQLAGFGNAVGGDSYAVQIAGFVNTNKSKTTGGQVAGFVNIVADEMNGFQISGFNNIATQTTGTQITGFVNIASKGMKGYQLSGFTNITADLKGAQISGFYNKAKEMDGFQLAGFINHAKVVKGIQLGIINIADTVSSGATLGLINVIKHGLHQFSVSHNDVTDLNLEFRSGTNKFYSIFSAGIQTKEAFVWSYGLGFGRQVDIYKKLYTNIELSSHNVAKKDEYQDEINLLNKFNLNFGYQLAPHLSLNAGPVLNLLVSRIYDEATGVYAYGLTNKPFYEELFDDTMVQMWLGYSASLKF